MDYFVSEVIDCKDKLLNSNDIRAMGEKVRQDIARLAIFLAMKGFLKLRI